MKQFNEKFKRRLYPRKTQEVRVEKLSVKNVEEPVKEKKTTDKPLKKKVQKKPLSITRPYDWMP